MMSKNEPISGEQDTIRRSKEPTVIKTASDKTESMEVATECGHDFDVFVTVLPLGLSCEEMGYSYEWNKGESTLSFLKTVKQVQV